MIMTRHINVMCTKSSISVNLWQTHRRMHTKTKEGDEAQGQPNCSMPGADGAQVPCSRAQQRKVVWCRVFQIHSSK